MLKKIMILGIAIGAVAIANQLTAQETKADKNQEVKALAVGDKAPDFELETFDRKTVKLSERFGKEGKNVILLFSRANW